jgi:hypothetical protein
MKCGATACAWFSTFFENAFGEPRKAADVLAHGEVLSLDVGGADLLSHGIADFRLDPLPESVEPA